MDVSRELGLINKHIRHRNQYAGESVVWYEFDPLQSDGGGSLYDDIYDEGGPGSTGRMYKKGVKVPTIYITEIEDSYRAIPEGRQPVQNIQATVLFEDLKRAGINNPREYNQHLNDIFLYDHRYYKVSDYKARGRVDSEVIVLVNGYEVFPDQEMPYDTGPDGIFETRLSWPTSFPS